MRKFHRLPNGFGSIKKLSGVRRNPYAAYPPTTAYHDNGSPVTNKAIGYFPTYSDALKALTQWNAEPIHLTRMTFDACYDAYFAQKFNGKRQYSISSVKSIKTAYNNCSAFHGRNMDTISASELQRMVDSYEGKRASVEQVVFLLKSMWKFAEQNDIVKKDVAKYLKINIPEDDEHGVPFSEDEIRKLWEMKDDKDIQVVLAMIYTGFRVSALESWEIGEDTIYGGVKTGKRNVPIHPSIQPFVRDVRMDYKFKRNFPKLMKSVGMNHTPHDCRHTFSWLCDKYGIDTISKHLLMGHSLGKDVEARVYSHRTMEQLQEEIRKIPCC